MTIWWITRYSRMGFSRNVFWTNDDLVEGIAMNNELSDHPWDPSVQ